MSITGSRPQISTAEIVRKQPGQPSTQTSRQPKYSDQENLFADDDAELIPEDEFDQMANKANAIANKNRGLNS